MVRSLPPTIKPQKHVRVYRTLEKDRAASEIPCAWDTETDGLNGELLAISWSTPDGSGIFRPDDLEAFIELLTQYPLPHVWFAHNAQYDWRYILDILVSRYRCQFLCRNGSDIFAIKFEVGPKVYCEMRDSLALWEGSLKTLLEKFAPDTPKLALDFSKEVFDYENQDHRDYAIRDSVGLRLAMGAMRETYKRLFDIFPGYTASGTSVKAWRKKLNGDKYYCLSRKMEEWFRGAYYGGLVFLTDNAPHENCTTYDINSSYPAAMLAGVPYGRPQEVSTFIADRPGFYEVEVEAPPDLRVPILGARDPDGIVRWPSGRFWTRCSTPELQFALEKGYRLCDVKKGYIFDRLIHPFDDLINICRSIRKEHSGTAFDTTAKLIQNSLYGKYLTKFIRTEIVQCDPYSEDVSNYDLLYETPGLYRQSVDDYQTLRMVHWGAWITATARLNLLRAAYAAGVDHVVYGDTDSITVRDTADVSKIECGLEYGQFKIEKRWRLFRAHGPKVYAGVLENGEVIGKAKGLPRRVMTAAHYQKILDHETFSVNYDSVPSLLGIINGCQKSGSGTTSQDRCLSDERKTRNWQIGHAADNAGTNPGPVHPRPLVARA